MQLIKFIERWRFRLISRLSIAQKIGYGYAFAVGIAVIGTAIGLVISNRYQKQARRELILAVEQKDLLNQLDIYLSDVRFHPQQLFTVVDNSIWFEYETSQLLTNVSQIQLILSKLDDFIDNNPDNIAIDVEEFYNIINNSPQTLNSYVAVMKYLWQELRTLRKDKQTAESEQKILSTITGEETIAIQIQLESLAEDLIRITQAAENQQQKANEKLVRADVLRSRIIITSMVASIMIAILLAIYTSKNIARPLQQVTKIAQQVAQEGDFSIQTTVNTQDEVGILAISLNQLISWAGEYTQELEHSRHTLEQRVEERTQELQETLQNLQQTQSQLIQTEKMSSLGQMVAGIAHEINNPVNFIHGNLIHINQYTHDILDLLKLYQEKYPDPAAEIENLIEAIELDFIQKDFLKLLDSMQMGTYRIKDIVLSLRNFSRLDEAEMKDANLHEGIDNTLLILNHRLKEGIEVIKNYGYLPLVCCYPAQLNQVFMNILGNAIDALLEGETKLKKIFITTKITDHNLIQVSIKDNGRGIPEEIKNKLFDPFFTTKPIGKGTGLGLSIAFQIIEKHQGKITVISELEKGTEFIISLPLKLNFLEYDNS